MLIMPGLIAREENKGRNEERISLERDLAFEPVPSKKFNDHGGPTTSQEVDPVLDHCEQKRAKVRHWHLSQSMQSNALLNTSRARRAGLCCDFA